MIDRLARRVMSMLGVGRSTAPSLEGATPSIQVSFIGTANAGPELRDEIPSMQIYGFASATLPGCDYAVGFLSGDKSKGVALATNDRRYRPASLKSGESVMYDNLGRMIYLSASGIVINGNGSTVQIEGSAVTITGPTTINGNTTIDGNLTVTGDLTGG
jgi:phage gp45-like